jgi:hypothetical protein
MANQFNFFRGIIGPRVVSIGGALNELNEPYIPLQITHAPPEGISNRHWNMLPQDLRGGSPRHMEVYIEGWEATRNNITVNPYIGINDNEVIEWSELWSRGRLAYHNRIEQNYRNVNPNPPIDERYPEYYNTDDHVFFDVSEERYDPIWSEPYKVMLFRSIEEGNTVEGQRIKPDHYMYNFPDVI